MFHPFPLPPATWLYDVVEEPLFVYGQAAQGGYALLDQSLRHLYPTHVTDLPPSSENLISKCLHTCPLAPASDYPNLQIRTSPLK